jgi:hypothetical protein
VVSASEDREHSALKARRIEVLQIGVQQALGPARPERLYDVCDVNHL